MGDRLVDYFYTSGFVATRSPRVVLEEDLLPPLVEVVVGKIDM